METKMPQPPTPPSSPSSSAAASGSSSALPGRPAATAPSATDGAHAQTLPRPARGPTCPAEARLATAATVASAGEAPQTTTSATSGPLPPPTMPDSVQFSRGFTNLAAPEFPANKKSEPLPESVGHYFPGARAHFRRRAVFGGTKEGEQTRVRANGNRAVLRRLGLPASKAQNYLAAATALAQTQEAHSPGETLAELALADLREGLHLMSAELRKKLGDTPENPAPHVAPLPIQIFRVECCRDYGPLSSAAAEALKEPFIRAAVQQSGNLYLEREWRNGSCPRVYVQPRIQKREFGRKERTSIKGYPKPNADAFRVEITYEYASVSKPLRTPEDLCAELRLIMQDASARLDLLHPVLIGAEKAVHVTESELLAAFADYRIRDCQNNKRWLECCRQITARGLYDPATVPTDQRVRRETMRERVAHPVWGILAKHNRGTGTGAGGVPFYLLRRDWRQALAEYPQVRAAKLGNDELIDTVRRLLDEAEEVGSNATATLVAFENEVANRVRSGKLDRNRHLPFDREPTAARK